MTSILSIVLLFSLTSFVVSTFSIPSGGVINTSPPSLQSKLLLEINRGGDGESQPDHPPSYVDPNSQISVEEHFQAWQLEQQQRYENQSELDQQNPRDEQGRVKLSFVVSRASISILFFVLIMRSLHHFELTDKIFKKSALRPFIIIPTIILFLSNMAGFVAAFSTPSSKTKRRMKAVINLNKLFELCQFLYCICRVTIFPNKYVERDIYVGRSLGHFIILAQCQLMTKVAWGISQVISPLPLSGHQDLGNYNSAVASTVEGERWDEGNDGGDHTFGAGYANENDTNARVIDNSNFR